MTGIDQLTGEVLFSDDRPYSCRVVAEEPIGNAAEIAGLASALRLMEGSEPLLRTFLISGSHSGDVIPLNQIGLVAESTSMLLSHPQLESEVVIFLKKVVRLCSAAQSQENPIVFV